MTFAYELLYFINNVRDLLIEFGVNAWSFFNNTVSVGDVTYTYLELLIGPGLVVILTMLVIKFIT